MARPTNSASRSAPVVGDSTGSTTMGSPGWAARSSRQALATAFTASTLPSIPTFTAESGKSAAAVSIWVRINSPATGVQAANSTVFCAVTQVTAQAAWQPRAVAVLTSAWMPAPEQLSEPATVRMHASMVLPTTSEPRITGTVPCAVGAGTSPLSATCRQLPRLHCAPMVTCTPTPATTPSHRRERQKTPGSLRQRQWQAGHRQQGPHRRQTGQRRCSSSHQSNRSHPMQRYRS